MTLTLTIAVKTWEQTRPCQPHQSLVPSDVERASAILIPFHLRKIQ